MRLIIIATDLADKESEGKDISEGRERLFVSNRATKKAVGWKGKKRRLSFEHTLSIRYIKPG